MRRLQALHRRLHSEEIGSGARIMAWIFALINIPGFILALATFWLWPITIPGMILFFNYWRSGFNRMTYSQTEALWIWTIVYNLFLLITGSLVLAIDGGSWEIWPALLPSLFGTAMAGIALRALRDHQDSPTSDLIQHMNEGEYLSDHLRPQAQNHKSDSGNIRYTT